MALFKKLAGPVGLALILVGGVAYGILYTSGLAAVLPLVVGLALVAAAGVLNLRGARTEGARRSARLGVNAAVSIVVLAAILIFLQTISARHNAAYDTTSNKRFSLSPQTDKILAGLTREIDIAAFYKEQGAGRLELEDLLKEYARTSHEIKFRFVDPDKDPAAAKRYKITAYGTTIVESGSNEEKVMGADEQKLTNAIVKVTREKRKVLYFVTGHGEKSIDDPGETGLSQLKQAAEAENYAVKDLFTLRDSIPGDCTMLAIPGPQKDLFPEERRMIESYLARAGKLLALADPFTELPQLDSLIARYGIRVTNTIVVDRFGRLLAGNYLTPVVNRYGRHPITEGFRLACFFPMACALEIDKKLPPGVKVETLASTGESAYAERDVAAALKGKTEYEPGKDIPGPINLGEVATKNLGPAPAQAQGPSSGPAAELVVFGDSDFASNAYLNLGGNKDLILNTVSWLAEEADLIAVRAKNPVAQPVVLVTRQGRVVFWLPVVGVPAFFAVLGIIVLIARRRAA
jgi:ABC-type uncharacterized transport system involved in gliding motility auxiliary subunit